MAPSRDELVLQAVESVALAHVTEADHRSRVTALVKNGGEEIFGGERCAVEPEYKFLPGRRHMTAHRCVESAFLGASARGGRRAMQQIVDCLAGEACRIGAKQTGRGRVGEADRAVLVYAADSIGD